MIQRPAPVLVSDMMLPLGPLLSEPLIVLASVFPAFRVIVSAPPLMLGVPKNCRPLVRLSGPVPSASIVPPPVPTPHCVLVELLLAPPVQSAVPPSSTTSIVLVARPRLL